MSARRSVKRAFAQVDRWFTPPAGLTILLYHRIGGGSSSEVDLPVDTFRAQLDHLRAHHRVVDLATAVDLLAAGSDTPAAAESTVAESTVAITFDDGTADFCDHAVPALAAADLPATLFVATAFVDGGEPFPWGAPPATWEGLGDAVSTGLVTIGSHTHSHTLADRTGREEFAADLDRSITLIGEHVGVAPEHFAYAKALPGTSAAEFAVRSRFRSASLAGNRVNRPGATDVFRLSRTPIQRSDGMDFFAHKAAGGLRLEGDLRTLAARVRYRTASH